MEENDFYSPAVLTFHFSVRVHSLLPSSLCTLGLDLVVMSQIPPKQACGRGCGGNSQVRLSGFAPGWEAGVWEEPCLAQPSTGKAWQAESGLHCAGIGLG